MIDKIKTFRQIKTKFIVDFYLQVGLFKRIIIFCRLGLFIGMIYLIIEALSDYFDTATSYCDDSPSDSRNSYISFIKKNWVYIGAGLLFVAAAAAAYYCGPVSFNETRTIEDSTRTIEVLTRTIGTQTGVDTQTNIAEIQTGIKIQTGVKTQTISVETQTDIAGILTRIATISVETQTEVVGAQQELHISQIELYHIQTESSEPRVPEPLGTIEEIVNANKRHSVATHMEMDLLHREHFTGHIGLSLTEEGFHHQALFHKLPFELEAGPAQHLADQAAVWYLEHRVFWNVDYDVLLKASRRVLENQERFTPFNILRASEYQLFLKGRDLSKVMTINLIEWLRDRYNITEEDFIEETFSDYE